MKSSNSIVVEQGGALGYMPQLDSLRAFAVGLVFLSHWVDKTGVTGMLGVRLFFVLSGFLITSILLRVRNQTGQIHWRTQLRHFYARRMLRLYPALLLLIVVLLVFDFGTIRSTWGWHLSYLSNVRFAITGNYELGVGPLWSLSVEEQFYLVWPLVILLAPRRFYLASVSVLIVTAILWRVVVWKLNANFMGDYVLPFKWLDGLGLGALLALVWESPGNSRINAGTVRSVARNIGVPLFLFCLAARILGRWTTVTTLLLDLSASLAFLWLVANASKGFRGIPGRLLEFKPLLYLGRISYGLYLYHALAPDTFKLMLRRLNVPLTSWDVPQGLYDFFAAVAGPFATKLTAIVMLVVYCALVIAAASLSWYLWEKPLNGLRRYIRYEGVVPTPTPQSSATFAAPMETVTSA